MSHTPGPWTVKHIGGGNFAVQEFEIRGMFGDSPGVAPIFNKRRSGIDGTTIFTSPEDARLIAAAPELLKALEIITNNYQAAMQLLQLSPDTEDMATARAAIRKAKGYDQHP